MKNFSPKISIITVNYNSGEALFTTCDSIIGQSYLNYELIVVDGGSNDGSERGFDGLRNRFTSIQTNLLLISEKDKGIYDALNKGMGYATGDFCMMLNSGDLFFNELSLEKMVGNISNPDSIYYGRAKVQAMNGFFFKPGHEALDIRFIRKYPIHQSLLIPRKFFDLRYDTSFKISGDTDYLGKLFRITTPVFIDIDFVIFFLGGVSSAPRNFLSFTRLLRESVIVSWRYDAYRLISVPRIVLALSAKYLMSILLPRKIANKFLLKIQSLLGKNED